MTANRYPIGVSSYHDGTSTSPRGRMQTVTSAFVAAQVRSAAVEFDRDVLNNNGEHLTPNEGVRELPRQRELFDLHQRFPGVWALAATPGYSTHDPSIGTAVDFGITRKDGTNRALTAAEWPKLYTILARRGWVHTGAGFRVYEAWHCNGGYSYTLPPINGAPLMGETEPTTDTDTDKDDEDMLRFHVATEDGAITAFVEGRSAVLSQFTIGGRKFSPKDQAALLRRLYNTSPAGALTTSRLDRQALQKIMRGMK